MNYKETNKSFQKSSSHQLDAVQVLDLTERSMLAQDIHDDLGQKLTVLQFKLKQIESMSTESLGPQAKKVFQALEIHVNEAQESLRRTLRGLNPLELELLGFENAIYRLCEDLESSASVRIERSLDLEPLSKKGLKISASIQTALFRIAQTLLTNFAKHSKSKLGYLKIFIDQDQSAIILVVSDQSLKEGLIKPEHIEKKAGMGLLGVRTRAQLLGGKSEWCSVQGYCFKVTLPLKHKISGEKKS